MFAVTYRIRVRPDQRQAFSVCWRTIAEAKRDHCGGLGAELFVQSDGTHVVLERWPDKATFDRCALPESYHGLDGELRALCTAWEETAQLEQAESVA
jgi:quinol monooxygenase YgiN